MKLAMTILLAAQLCCNACEQRDTLLAVFWNLENFYDYHSESKPAIWTAGRFRSKCNAVAKTLLKIAERYGRYPDIAAFSEMENPFVTRSLLATTLLSKLGYSYVHYDSHDHRNMDCSLIYREAELKLKSSEPKHIYSEEGEILPTRDILLVQFDKLSVLVNHHPSQIGNKSEGRIRARERMTEIVDSLLSGGNQRVLALGDFNESLWPWKGQGTIKYNGLWEKIDGCFHYGEIELHEYVYEDDMLLTKDKTYGGVKPRRCFTGPSYSGGISDHLPIVLLISF